MKEAKTLSLTMLAAQSHTMRAADDSVIQVVALNASFDPEVGFDAEMKVRFAEEHTIGQLRPGNSYKVTIEDLGRIEPQAIEFELPAEDPATPVAPAPDQQVQVGTEPTPATDTPQQVQV